MLDLGCSYAINGALMKYALGYEQLGQRYTPRPAIAHERGHACARPCLLPRWPKHSDVRVIGLDISENAIRYAEDCGILDHGLAIDLESRDPTP